MDNELTRREAMAVAGVAATMGMLSAALGSEAMAQPPKEGGPAFMHKLPPLPYPEDALEPVIDKETVKIHYEKHFAGYSQGSQRCPAEVAKGKSRRTLRGNQGPEPRSRV